MYHWQADVSTRWDLDWQRKVLVCFFGGWDLVSCDIRIARSLAPSDRGRWQLPRGREKGAYHGYSQDQDQDRRRDRLRRRQRGRRQQLRHRHQHHHRRHQEEILKRWMRQADDIESTDVVFGIVFFLYITICLSHSLHRCVSMLMSRKRRKRTKTQTAKANSPPLPPGLPAVRFMSMNWYNH